MIKIKSPEEIEKVRSACLIVGQVLKDIDKYVKEGISTAELDRIGEELIIKHGGIPAFKGYRGYKHATCISVNEEVVHGIPGKKLLKAGDVVGVDIGAIKEGYYGDAAYTFCIGEPSKNVDRLLRYGRECLKKGIKQARAGKHVGDISAAIEKHAKSGGFSVVKDLFGHGVGKELHEDPLIPNFGKPGEGPKLLKGMTLAIEPMLNVGGYEIVTLSDGWTVVTKDKSLSVHFEHTILIGEKESEVLTCHPKM